jgi:membrane protein YdbS with pleckstrin-like domain
MKPKANITEREAKQRLVTGIVFFVAAVAAAVGAFVSADWMWWLLAASACLSAVGAFCIYEWKHRW